MGYYSYHNTAKGLVRAGKLERWYFAGKHGRISPALVLVFRDPVHTVMPIREYRWHEYLPLLPKELKREDNV